MTRTEFGPSRNAHFNGAKPAINLTPTRPQRRRTATHSDAPSRRGESAPYPDRLSAYRISDALMGVWAGVIVSDGTRSIADRVGLIAIRT